MKTHTPTSLVVQDLLNGTYLVPGIYEGPDRELAFRIVRAVNAHEELLNACKFLVEQHRFLQSHTANQIPARIYQAIEKAAEAIAKAEGK